MIVYYLGPHGFTKTLTAIEGRLLAIDRDTEVPLASIRVNETRDCRYDLVVDAGLVYRKDGTSVLDERNV